MTVTLAGFASATATGMSIRAAMSAQMRVVAMARDLSHELVKQAVGHGRRKWRHDPARAPRTVGDPALRAAREPAALSLPRGQRRAARTVQRARDRDPRARAARGARFARAAVD